MPLDGPKVNAVSPMVREGPTDETETTVATTEANKETECETAASTSDISLENLVPPNFDISDVIAIRLKVSKSSKVD